MKLDVSLPGLIVFSILMENNGGILDKAPSYILEKIKACSGNNHPEWLLDPINKRKYEKYMKRWGLHMEV